MVQTREPDINEIEQRFSSLSSLQADYSVSNQKVKDDEVIQHEESVAGPSQLELDRQNSGSKDSILQNIAEIPADLAVGAVRGVGNILHNVGIAETDNPFNLNPEDDQFSAMVQGGGAFITPYAGLFKGVSAATKMVGLMKGSPKLKLAIDSIVAAAPVDALAYRPQDGNMFNAVSMIVADDSRAGALIKEYLAVQTTDSDRKAMLKNVGGGLLGSLFLGKIVQLGGAAIKGGAKAVSNVKNSGSVFSDTNVPHVDDTFGAGSAKAEKEAIESAGKAPDVEAPEAALKEASDEAVDQYFDALDRIPHDERAIMLNKLPNEETAILRETNKEVEDFASFYQSSPPEMKAEALRIFKDVLDGKDLSATDLESLSPFNLTKLNSPLERKVILAQLGEIMKDSLPRNTGDPKLRRAALDLEINKVVKYFGTTAEKFVAHLKTVASSVEDAFPYIQASKILTDLQVQRALKAGRNAIGSRSTKSMNDFTAQLAGAIETAQASSGLGTSFGRGLAEFKNIADSQSLASQSSLIKAQLAHDVITSTPEIGARRATNLVILDDLAKFEKKADPDRFASDKPKAPRTDAQKAEANIKRLKKRIQDVKAGKIDAPKRQVTEFENALKEELKALQAEKKLDEIFSSNNLQSRAMLKASRLSLGAKTRDTLLEIYVNGLLSSVKTSAVNFTGNSTAIMSSIVDRTYAGLAGDSVNGVTLGEAGQLTWGYVSALPDMWKTFWYAAKNGPSSSAVKQDMIKPHDRSLTPELWGLSGNIGKAVSFIGSAVNLPGKGLLAADEAFKMVNYRAEIIALSYRKARKLLGEGADSKSVAIKQTEIKNDILHHQDILDEAKSFSELNTFTNKLPEVDNVDFETGRVHQTGGFARTFQQLIDKDPSGMMRVFIPFFQTPVNLISFAKLRTPFLRKIGGTLKDELQSTNVATRQLAEAKVATGNLMWTTAIGLAMTGNFTGPPPTDPDLRRAKEAAGVKWFSMMTDDGYVAYDPLDPTGMILGGAATMSIMATSLINLTKQGSEQGFDQDIFDKYQETFANAVVGSVRLVSDNHFLPSFANMIDFLSGDSRGFSRGLNSVATAANPVASFYSSFRRGVQKAVDPTVDTKLRQDEIETDDPARAGFNATVGFLKEMFDKSLKGTTPGYDRDASVNLVGEKKFHPGTSQSDDLHITPFEIMANFASTGLSPFAISKKSKSNVMNKLGELESRYQGPEMVKSISGVKLTQKEHKFFADVWTNLNKGSEKWVGSKSFNAMPEGSQLLQLENKLNLNKSIAEIQTSTKFPRLVTATMNSKFDSLRFLSKETVAKTGNPNLF